MWIPHELERVACDETDGSVVLKEGNLKKCHQEKSE